MFDPLAMPVGADTSLVLTTLETISLLRDEFGVNTTLGASNVSFGMPDRHAIGAAFLPMAITHGLTTAIMDARSPQLVSAVKAADLLTNRDPWGAAWIAAHRARQAAAAAARRPTSAMTDTQVTGAAPPGRPGLPSQRDAGAGAAGGHRVRRGELERHRHRLDLRRPRHLQEVQGADRRRPVPASPLDARAFSPDELRAGWRLACRALAGTDLSVEVPPLVTRPKAATRRGRPPGHPAARPRRSATWSWPSRPCPTSSTDLERVLAALDDLELRVDLAVRAHARPGAARGRLQGHRGHRGRRADRRAAGRHHGHAVRDRLRPGHHHGRGHAAGPGHRHAAGRGARC